MTPVPSSPVRTMPYWRISAYYFFYFAFVGVFAPYFSLYLKSLAFSAFEIAVLMSVMQGMRVLAPSLWGWCAEYLNTRMPVVRLSACMSLIGILLFFWRTDFYGLFIAMAWMAFFWSAALPLIESVTFIYLQTDSHRYGRIRAWGSVGFISAVLALGSGLDFMPITAVLWALLVVMLGIIICAFCVPEVRRPPEAQADIRIGETLRQPAVRALLGASFLIAAAHGPFYIFFSILVIEHQHDSVWIGRLWALGVVAEILVFLYMPRVIERYALRTILLVAGGATVLRFVLTGWGADALICLLLAQLLHGVTFGASHAAAIAAVNQWFSGKLQARGQALYGSLSFGAGGMLGGLVGGYAWDGLGSAWAFIAGAGFALAAVVWLWRGWRPESVA